MICALGAEFGRWGIRSWQTDTRHLGAPFEKTLLRLVTRTYVRSGIHGCIIARRYRVAFLLWDLESLVVLSCCCCLRCAIGLSFAYTGCLLDWLIGQGTGWMDGWIALTTDYSGWKH